MSVGIMSNPTDLWAFLDSLGVRAKKGLSQNFLIDGNIIKGIVRAAEVHSGDVVLEIGPGPGALTQALLATGATVIAVEKDDAFAGALSRFDPEGSRLHVYHADFMAFPLGDVLRQHLRVGQKVKIVSNLPYHLTTPIVTKLSCMHDLISTVVVMVQNEVAQRMVADPGSRVFGSLSVFLQFYADVTYGFKVSNRCFSPAPKVDSAIVKLKLKTPPKVSCEDGFFRLVRRAFQQRRKMLRSSLRELYSSDIIISALGEAGLNVESRPERLSVNDFIHLYELCEKESNS
ncbi:Ribosomal RNA small subunit methyltransferase A [Chlamydiales bacterium SCGC AG-110-M15]|nr:Ribosomal RNA small subunit methyltransferase A [Chlamydiales bacterium SCGC AG-110-M15]